MEKRIIAKAFNEAPKMEWTTIASEKIMLTNAFFDEGEESYEEIDALVGQYLEKFLTAAVRKKIYGLKVLTTWPADGSAMRPYVHRMEVFRFSPNKYILLVLVHNLAEAA